MVKNWGASEEPGDGGFCPCAFSFLRSVMVGYVHTTTLPNTLQSRHRIRRRCTNTREIVLRTRPTAWTLPSQFIPTQSFLLSSHKETNWRSWSPQYLGLTTSIGLFDLDYQKDAR